MTLTCKNCNNHFEGHYCNNCGQDAHTGRLSLHSVWHEIEHALLHLDKGFLYTTKQLFTRPGHSIREFIEGRRVKHFKPLSLVIVLTTVQALLYHYFKVDLLQGRMRVTAETDSSSVTAQEMNEWMTTHFSINTVIFLVFGSLASFLVFKKRGYNFIEHLFINAFNTSQHLIVHLVAFPIIYMVNGTIGFVMLNFLLNLANVGLSVWTFIQFFYTQSKIKIFFLSLLTHVLTLAFVVITVILVGNLLNLITHH